MSFSISAKGKTKDEVRAAIASKLDEVVTQQPIHSKDSGHVQNVLNSYLDILEAEPAEGQIIVASVSGYLSWQPDQKISGANINITVNIAAE